MNALLQHGALHPTEFAIHTSALTHAWGAQGVHELELRVPNAGIYGFLGPNGAGKTTTIRLLLGLLQPQAGRVLINGIDLERDRLGALQRVGALVESPSLYPHLSAWDNLRVTATLLGIDRSRLHQVLELVDLVDAANKPVKEFSLGMRQRLGLALALLPSPRLLILDEPSNGLDPAGMVDMRHLFQRLVAETGMTIFLSSHLLGEIDQIATHIGVIQQGRLLFQGDIAEFRSLRKPRLLLRVDDVVRTRTVLSDLGELLHSNEDGDLVIEQPVHAPSALNRCLVEAGVAVEMLHLTQQSLESTFLTMTATPGAHAA